MCQPEGVRALWGEGRRGAWCTVPTRAQGHSSLASAPAHPRRPMPTPGAFLPWPGEKGLASPVGIRARPAARDSRGELSFRCVLGM